MALATSLPAFLLISASPGPATSLIVRRPRIRRRLDAVGGTVLVGLGLRVALTSR